LHPAAVAALRTPPARRGEADSHLLVKDVAQFHATAAHYPAFIAYVTSSFIPSLGLSPEVSMILLQATKEFSEEKLGQYYISILPQN
jgi:hypothetical protein